MMNKRKGTPCGCDSDPCGCSPKSQCVKTINGQYPDANHEFGINAGEGVTVTPDGNGIRIGISLASPMVFRGTVGTGGIIATLPPANSDNLGWTYVAISSGNTPDTPPKAYDVGDMLISNGVEWSVVPSGDDPVDWSQIQNKPTTVSGYGITDAVDTGSAQTITNIKTFTRPSNSNGLIIVKRDGTDSTTAITNGTISFSTNGGTKGTVNNWEDGNAVHTQLGATGNSPYQIQVNSSKASASGWAESPYRSYSASNVGDIVTIGSLALNPNVMHKTVSKTTTTVNGMNITKEYIDGKICILSGHGTPTATGDYLVTSGVTENEGVVPMMSGQRQINGFLYPGGSGTVWMRIADNSVEIAFRTVYIVS